MINNLFHAGGGYSIFHNYIKNKKEGNYLSAIMTIIDDANPAIPVTGDVSWIQGKRCLAKTLSDGTVAICYLSDTDSTKFHDGTTADLTGPMGEFMVHFPDTWVKCSDNTVEVSNGDNGGHKFNKVLLGAVHATDYNDSLCSVINQTPRVNTNIIEFQTMAQAKGSNWNIMSYETRNKISIMGFAKYATRDLQTIVGNGDSGYGFVEGTTVSLGNADGEITDGNICNSILGIENYFNNVIDFLSGIYIQYYTDKEPEIVIGDRKIPVPGYTQGGNITKMLWGEHADLIPVAWNDDTSFSTYYADGVLFLEAYEDGLLFVVAGGSGAAPYGGASFFFASADASHAVSGIGARLEYTGDFKIIDNVEEFKTLG